MALAQPISENSYTARGVVNAVDQATLSSGVSSRIDDISRKRGEAFDKGDVLIRFDCGLEIANLQAARARYNVAAKTLEKNQELLTFAATGQFDVDILKAELDQSRADLKARQVVVDECKIVAPFKGRVVELAVAPFESVEAVQPLIEIVGTQAYEVTFIVSSDWIAWLNDDHKFSLTLDNIGQRVDGHVDRVGAIVDPVSQTVEVIGVIDAPGNTVRAGMSGVATFAPPIGG